MHHLKMYELTNPQKSIWNMEKYFEGTTINNICTPAIIYEKLDKEILERAINNVIKNNDNFRIQIDLNGGIPMQYFTEYKPFKLEFININDKSDLKVIESEEVSKKFEILNSSLFRFKIAIFKDDFFAVILTVHHIIADSWALGLVIKNILKEYHALKNNITLNEEPHSYIDYINSEENYKKQEKYKKDKEYWQEKFKDIPESASIPSLKKNQKNISYKAKRESFNLDANFMQQINNFCKENRISIFNFLMSIYAIYISRVSHTDDFVIGTPILNRTNYQEKQTMGMFVNTVPIRISNISDLRFIDFVKSLSSTIVGVLRHQKYSYTQILEDLRSKNSNISSLYNILISYQITKAFDEEYGKYKTDWVFNNYCSSDFNIHITDINDTGDLIVSYDYLIDKYNFKDIQDFHARIIYIIEQVLCNKNISANNIEIVTENEKNAIFDMFDNTSVNYPKDKTIVDLFEDQAQKTPDNIAIAFEDKTLTYKELNKKANSLANFLIKKGLKKHDIIAIRIDKSIEMIVGILAIIKLRRLLFTN